MSVLDETNIGEGMKMMQNPITKFQPEVYNTAGEAATRVLELNHFCYTYEYNHDTEKWVVRLMTDEEYTESQRGMTGLVHADSDSRTTPYFRRAV